MRIELDNIKMRLEQRVYPFEIRNLEKRLRQVELKLGIR